MNLHDCDIIRAAKKEGAHENAIETAKILLADGRYSAKEISELFGIAEEDIQNLVIESTSNSNRV